MTRAACSDEEFNELFNEMGATKLAKHLNLSERAIFKRRRSLEKRFGVTVNGPDSTRSASPWPGCVDIEVLNGTILVGSDFHIWPGNESTCLKAFKKFVADIRPDAVILNGDVMDFPKISRYPQGWESAPEVHEELEAAQDHLHDIEQRCKRGTHKIGTRGNHDHRFEAMIAAVAPQYRKINGIHLYDHFVTWQKAMSVRVNDSVEAGRTMIKHRLSGGIHAIYNNAKKAGCHVITGHLHAQNIRMTSDYRHFDLYSVDTGVIAEKYHAAFAYNENNPVDWRSGFALLTYKNGILMMPELINKWNDQYVWFRGKLHRV